MAGAKVGGWLPHWDEDLDGFDCLCFSSFGARPCPPDLEISKSSKASSQWGIQVNQQSTKKILEPSSERRRSPYENYCDTRESLTWARLCPGEAAKTWRQAF